ncbi:CTP synthetase [Aliiroseovarius lamellibrachiae]|uniref:CTP synthetase n=1 Tax=Aliiroseovarius lamellibrachiae TaxID=1924933 RepID=UPI001BDFB6E1|nr:CTP synthetase [Aliiroseovarius lamellibrachiae]MBT2130357.1 CTP synthetase [Aliiroseovarius lamellibrachiae]
MLRLTAVIYVLLGTTLAGIFIIAALTMGLDTGKPIIYAAIAGFVVGLPISWVVAKQISNLS